VHRILRHSLLAAVAIAGAVWLTGCSNTVSPGSNAIHDPIFLQSASHRVGPYSAQSGSTDALSGSADIDGAQGGQLQVGRFTLTVPAGAWSGVATVTINVPSAAIVHCQLHITPESANAFKLPVVLRTDCSGTDAFDPASLAEIWYDVAAGVWREVPGSRPDVMEFDVVAPLSHFSDYGVVALVAGKAGW
jgi:hypothetical protein